MPHHFGDIAFTDNVKRLQEAAGSRESYARMAAAPGPTEARLGENEAAFLASRDSFYLASVGETGWPYIQHRGGPEGFVRVLDDRTIGFADFRGNRQYVSVGNLMHDDRVSLFFMDYARRARLKMLGRVQLVGPGEEAMLARLAVGDYRAKVERGFLIRIEAFDWNCPQHITERYTLAEIETAINPLRARIAELEGELATARGVTVQA
jgi:hypothetical protein